MTRESRPPIASKVRAGQRPLQYRAECARSASDHIRLAQVHERIADAPTPNARRFQESGESSDKARVRRAGAQRADARNVERRIDSNQSILGDNYIVDVSRGRSCN